MFNEHTPDAFLEPAYILVSKVWVNQTRVQDLADGKLTLLSGIPPQEHLIGVQTDVLKLTFGGRLIFRNRAPLLWNVKGIVHPEMKILLLIT